MDREDQITEYLNGELYGILTGEYVGEISSKELKACLA
jgi:hypothetical protein